MRRLGGIQVAVAILRRKGTPPHPETSEALALMLAALARRNRANASKLHSCGAVRPMIQLLSEAPPQGNGVLHCARVLSMRFACLHIFVEQNIHPDSNSLSVEIAHGRLSQSLGRR